MGPIDVALRALFAAQETLRGERVLYRVGARDVELVALRGQTQAVTESIDGTQFEATTVDWLVDPDELQFDGVPFDPEIGHTLTDEDGRRYTTAYIAGEKVWRPMSSERMTPRIRIHTVKVESTGEP